MAITGEQDIVRIQFEIKAPRFHHSTQSYIFSFIIIQSKGQTWFKNLNTSHSGITTERKLITYYQLNFKKYITLLTVYLTYLKYII